MRLGHVIQTEWRWDQGGVGRDDQVEACYGEHAEALRRFAVSLVGPSDAADILSVAILNVLQTTSTIHDLRSYLYRCVHRAALQHWRSHRRRLRREDQVRASILTEDHYTDPTITDALLAMSPRQRAVAHLTYWEDLTTTEITTRLDISVGTVKRHRTRVHHKLKEALADG